MKIKKYFEYIITKIVQKIHQKNFYYDNVKLKYMLKRTTKSNELIVVFSACTRKGIKARYNYVRTLKNVNKNKLFILDDFGKDKRGMYYLGEYPFFKVERATYELIEKVKTELKCFKIYFVGSSKGAWVALNFGTLFQKSVVIIGAPQFFLGKYLKAPANKITLEGISENANMDDVCKTLDMHLKQKIDNCKNKKNIKIYIHYSNKEHTYNEHVKFLLEELKKVNIETIEDIKTYQNHEEVSMFFPSFLLRSIENGKDQI